MRRSQGGLLAGGLLVAGMVAMASGSSAVVPGQSVSQEYLLTPDRVFDGTRIQEGFVVHVRGNRIVSVGAAATVTAPDAEVIDLPGTTLLPGLIDAHSHVLLHPYDETP